ncbi:unnamed protein product [Mytilus edulis]|uniref:Uncharacterized protein n=1 Tax=Mytilus edulis TaxID=6550 RepID=A0A8S3U2D3_MYTED|nr:unnamed protein product [Mytilus edulis]
MKGSDLDIMRTIRYIEVCENTDIRFKHDKTYFTMETEDTKPGFTQLRLVYTDHGTPVDIFELCEEIGDEYYFSNFKFKRKFTGCVWSTVHGPCLNDESGQYDMAYCLHKSATANKSLALYGYMCQNIVGTEEHVKNFRMMNSVRDNLTCDKCWKTITSGSFG